MTEGSQLIRGLEGVVAAETSLCDLDAARRRDAIRVSSQIATAICAHHRVRSGQPPVARGSDLSHAANFRYMRTGTRPPPDVTKAFDASLTRYAGHELDASTVSTR